MKIDITRILVNVLCLYFILYISTAFSEKEKYQMNQVIILSRHNVRTPLAKSLDLTTPKPWPKWEAETGYLTPKGALLEGLMGEYFSLWFRNEGLLSERCPTKEELYVYANSKQRTRKSAERFINKGFPECNITVHYAKGIDSVFNPIIHNITDEFKQIAYEEMNDYLKQLKLNDSYNIIQDILNFNNSLMCADYHICNLSTDRNYVNEVDTGKKPNVIGPLKICSSVIDAFIMENYEGLHFKDVAWGLLYNSSMWHQTIAAHIGYLNTIFSTSLISRDISKPLLRYMSDIFLNDDEVPKVTLLMGHDANLITVLKAMNFKPFDMHNNYERTPVGGKIVFQKWLNVDTNTDMLKINYVYQSTEQMRLGLKLNLENPPQFSLLELADCTINEDGFCLWDDFKRLLINLMQF